MGIPSKYWRPIAIPAAVVFLAVAGWLLVATQGEDRINKANYDLIEAGMTEAEVVSILGRPGVVLTTEDRYYHSHDDESKVWLGRRSKISVHFNDGRATGGKAFSRHYRARTPTERFWLKLKIRLGLD